MSELNWIKHDGGPMPVPGETIVRINTSPDMAMDCRQGVLEFDDYGYSDTAGFWNAGVLSWWEGKGGEITEYAIVGDATAPEIDAPIDEISDMLAERGNRYGPFDGHAKITQAIKRSYYDSPNWLILPPDMKEALDMIAHKIGRILNGDPNYRDSWIDMVGYAKLISDLLED